MKSTPPRTRPMVAPATEVQRTEQAEQARPMSEKDPAYTSIGLPSNFQWYPFKQLSVRPLRIPEVKKMWTAHVTKSLRTMIEALAPCLDQDIMSLTVGDIYSVMYWLRLNSYPKNPYTIRYSCQNPEHVQRVAKPKKNQEVWGVDTFRNEATVSSSMLEEVPMKPLAEISEHLKNMDLVKSGIAFYPSTVRDLVEVDELAQESEFDPGDDMLCKYATYLDRRHGMTLSDRAKFMMADDRFGPDAFMEMEGLIDILTHGVRETVNLNCGKCGASNRVLIPIDARTFLPHLL